MAKYINVDNLHFPNIAVFEMKLHGATVPMVRLVDLQKLSPEEDVQPVVRCKDCKHRDPDDKKCDCGGLEHAHMFPVSDDWYCADGERMEKNNE